MIQEEYDGTTDGTFNKKRYFTCPASKALFLKATKCKPDRRFEDAGKGGFVNNNVSPSAPALGKKNRYSQFKKSMENCGGFPICVCKYLFLLRKILVAGKSKNVEINPMLFCCNNV